MKKKVFAGLLAVLTAMTALPVGNVVSAQDVNLVSGLPYTVKTGVGIEYSYKLYGAESDPADGKLTDGKRASGTSFSDPAWHKFYRGLSRTVEFALPSEKAVTGFCVSLVHSNGAGLPLPPSFDLYVSEDGTHWMLAGSYDATSLQAQEGTSYRRLRADFDKRYKAKFLRLTFRMSVSLYMDELEVYGGDVNGTEEVFAETPEPVYKNEYNMGLEGCKDTVLLYCGYPGSYDVSYVQNTEEEMLYYFGYVAKDGTVQDTFFDSFQFAPLRGATPSGGILNESGKTQTIKSDWEYYLDSVFDETYNCGAIEKAMETVKTATGKTDAKVSMILTIPFPTVGNKPFGDIDGDGKDEYCRNRDEQMAIYRWFFDQVEHRLADRSYQNIRLGGFYWEQEGLTMTEDYYSLVRSVAEEIHRRDSYFFWIPFLYGNGFDMVEEIGFDSAVMQPNYAFLDYIQEPFLGELDVELRKYGLGIEVEIHWDVATNDDYYARYYGYLNGGYALGYMHGANAYYQNSNPGTYYHMAKSSTAKLRNIYDDTYAYVKGTYVPRQVDLYCRKADVTIQSGKSARGSVQLALGCIGASLGRGEWTVTQLPENGTVELSKDGVYRYTPQEGFVGTDSFSVQLVATYASSSPITITVTVEEPTLEPEESIPEETTAPATSTASVPSQPQPSHKPSALPWILLAGGVLLAAGAVTAWIIRRKKR